MQTVPLLWPSVLTPKSETAAIKDLYANLCGIAYNVNAWSAALELYEFAKKAPNSVNKDTARQWKFIASHECVMQLHHLRERFANIKGFKVHPCQSLKSSINASQMRNATRLLDVYFPHIDKLRHAIAHSGANETNSKEHAPDGQFGLVGFRELDRFSAPYQGALWQLDLTIESLNKINEVVAEFFGAFIKSSQMLELEGHLP